MLQDRAKNFSIRVAAGLPHTAAPPSIGRRKPTTLHNHSCVQLFCNSPAASDADQSSQSTTAESVTSLTTHNLPRSDSLETHGRRRRTWSGEREFLKGCRVANRRALLSSCSFTLPPTYSRTLYPVAALHRCRRPQLSPPFLSLARTSSSASAFATLAELTERPLAQPQLIPSTLHTMVYLAAARCTCPAAPRVLSPVHHSPFISLQTARISFASSASCATLTAHKMLLSTPSPSCSRGTFRSSRSRGSDC